MAKPRTHRPRHGGKRSQPPGALNIKLPANVRQATNLAAHIAPEHRRILMTVAGARPRDLPAQAAALAVGQHGAARDVLLAFAGLPILVAQFALLGEEERQRALVDLVAKRMPGETYEGAKVLLALLRRLDPHLRVTEKRGVQRRLTITAGIVTFTIWTSPAGPGGIARCALTGRHWVDLPDELLSELFAVAQAELRADRELQAACDGLVWTDLTLPRVA